MLSITKHANPHLRTRNVGKPHGTTETLILLWVIVLQPNLQLHCFSELPLLRFGICPDLGDGLLQCFTLQFTDEKKKKTAINKHPKGKLIQTLYAMDYQYRVSRG